ncbi:MAG: hypothetical protein JNL11_17295 [Bdellovibrionaceae bacterium]|nr:hypothetical protein [Pseudobdellovibrionaceae bacterium]
MKTIRALFLLLPYLLFLNSCITIGVSKDPQPARNLAFKAPSSPFSDLKTKTGDKAWISSRTNNIISYISDCSPSNDPSLDQLEQDALAGLDKLEIKYREDLPYNQRTARSTIGEGFLDGVKVKLNVVAFKKNSCSYNLIYGGVAERFDSENQEFKQFTESFRAP